MPRDTAAPPEAGWRLSRDFPRVARRGHDEMQRGDVWKARLDPVEGSEQQGRRPVIVVSRQGITQASSVVIVAPCTTYRQGRRVEQALLIALDLPGQRRP